MLVVGRLMHAPSVLVFRHVGRCNHRAKSAAGIQSQLLQQTARYHAQLLAEHGLTAEAVLAAQQMLAHTLALLHGNKMAAAHSKAVVRQQERRNKQRQRQQQQQQQAGGDGGEVASSSGSAFYRSCQRVHSAAEAARRRELDAQTGEHVQGWLQVWHPGS